MPSGLYPWTQAVSRDLLPSGVAVGGTMSKLNLPSACEMALLIPAIGDRDAAAENPREL
jgi:hypothetical protein